MIPSSALSDEALWSRIFSVALDAPDHDLTFSRRLARENGWTQAFALRCIDEYRRFTYLAMISGSDVTPSDAVDQVWHLHLTYTRHYWGDFADALGGPLHHGPTKGGTGEGRRFREQYLATLLLYTQEFGTEPPADIWPDVDDRMSRPLTARRVFTSHCFVIPKPPRWLTLSGAASIVIAPALPTATRAHNDLPEEWTIATITRMVRHWFESHTFPAVVISGVLIILVAAALFPSTAGRNRKGDGGSGCGSGDSGCGGGSGCGGCGG